MARKQEKQAISEDAQGILWRLAVVLSVVGAEGGTDDFPLGYHTEWIVWYVETVLTKEQRALWEVLRHDAACSCAELDKSIQKEVHRIEERAYALTDAKAAALRKLAHRMERLG